MRAAMDTITGWNRMLTARAMDGLAEIDGISVYGPREAARRTSLVASNLAGRNPMQVAEVARLATRVPAFDH